MDTIVTIVIIAVIVIYTAALFFVLAFSLTQAQLLLRYLFQRKKFQQAQQSPPQFLTLPAITVQLPIYNEKYVAERLIDCVANLDYPADKLEIQVLDDSTDETSEIIARKVKALKPFINIKHIRRANRLGFKAGALKEGLDKASGEFIAIFDADFLPQKDFLVRCIAQFANPEVGMVQTRWAWLNRNYSVITKVQAFALDTHFSIEQVGQFEEPGITWIEMTDHQHRYAKNGKADNA